MNLRGIDFTGLAMVAGGLLAVGLVAWVALKVYRGGQSVAQAVGELTDKAREAGAAVVDAVNPASPRNLAYRGANAITSAATGREETFGGWLYDKLHRDAFVPDPSGARLRSQFGEAAARDDARVAGGAVIYDAAGQRFMGVL